MAVTRQARAAFHATGRRLGHELAPVSGLDLRPLLLARYRDLTTLRYDFPLILVRNAADGTFVRSLSGVMDDAIASVVHTDGESRVSSDALRLELDIRALVARGQRGSLVELWNSAAALHAHGDLQIQHSLKRARAALSVDGEVIDCDGELPRRLFEHAWRQVHDRKASRFRDRASRLARQLRELLRGDFARSEAARDAGRLKATFAGHDDAFDFAALSRVLASAKPATTMAESRRRRIERLVHAIESQRLYPAPGEPGDSVIFDSCHTAMETYRQRLPSLVALARHLTIAELEIAGVYDETRHDAFFEDLNGDATPLSPDDLGAFPTYFVLVDAADMDPAEPSAIVDALSAGLPMHVLFQADLRSAPLATMAMGLANAFVLQTPGSHVYQMRRQIAAGFAFQGPALFSVLSGVSSDVTTLPAYLVGAAALESRAFPAFAYDPAAGGDWTSRVDVSANPQPDRDWPVHRIEYEDRQHQRVSVEAAFTFADFAACDGRYARHLALVPELGFADGLLPVREWLAAEPAREALAAPSIAMVDRNNRLQHVLVDDTLIRETRQCLDRWHSLQELGRARRQTATEPPAAPAPSAAVAAAAPATSTTPAAPDIVPSSDDPYVETPRCSTCNECIQINNRMFAYNENRQAYIADATAGTYRQLVEAAESCQVSIIHPGKPRDPNEPGLDELIARAQAFA